MKLNSISKLLLFCVLVLCLASCVPSQEATEAPVETGGDQEPTTVTTDAEIEEEVIDKPPYPYEGELVISVWGGTTEEFFRNYVDPKFNELYPDVTVVYDVGGSGDRHNRIINQATNPVVDLYISDAEKLADAINRDLLSPINPDNIPNLAEVYDWAKPYPEYGAAYGAIACGIAYNPDYFGDDPPSSWMDLWRPDVQGKISIPAIGSGLMPYFVLEAAEMAGGSIDIIEPAWAKLAELDPGIQHVFYAEWLPSFEAGDIVMATEHDYYVHAIADQGVNIEYVVPEEGGWGFLQHMSIVKGSENQEMVERYINLMLSPEMQQIIGETLMNAPTRKGIQLSEELADRLAVYGDTAEMIDWFDPAVAVEVRPIWTEKLNTEVAPSWGE